MESAISIVYEFDKLSCAIIKHSNPCGFGCGNNNLEAYTNAISTDPISYFGGIVAFNNEVDSTEANELVKVFLECIIAPSFSKKALNILKRKPNLRIIVLKKSDLINNSNSMIVKSVFNGYLYQNKDSFINKIRDCDVVTVKKPNKDDYKAISIGWTIVKSVKSNAIVLSNRKKILGIGAGQMSRVDSVKIAIRKSKENNLNLKGSIMASDAFFPFPDSLELAAKEGITGVIQPGGSIKDKEIIHAANKLNLFMILTRERHFLH
jgi:phosphoribosylaminoimidazolecarboxamide formyltransferase/IMP cyclohydrolase